MHTTVITSEVDRKIFKKLGVGLNPENSSAKTDPKQRLILNVFKKSQDR
jgi:hypothetical protein